MSYVGRPSPCDNMNHRRADAPVPYCPECGEVVNSALPAHECTPGDHAMARRRGSRFCVGCGAELIPPLT